MTFLIIAAVSILILFNLIFVLVVCLVVPRAIRRTNRERFVILDAVFLDRDGEILADWRPRMDAFNTVSFQDHGFAILRMDDPFDLYPHIELVYDAKVRLASFEKGALL